MLTIGLMFLRLTYLTAVVAFFLAAREFLRQRLSLGRHEIFSDDECFAQISACRRQPLPVTPP